MCIDRTLSRSEDRRRIIRCLHDVLRRVALAAAMAGCIVLLATPARACTEVRKSWSPSLTLATTGQAKVHDMVVWNRRLWIAQGSGLHGEGKTLIRSYDIDSRILTTEFEVPIDTYAGKPYWRVLMVFNGALYAGLGNNDNVSGTGDVYRFDGETWNKVLETTENDVYSLQVYDGKLYAGAGSDGFGAGKLYESTGGVSWRLLKTFSSDHVRVLRTWRGRLYIGLKKAARLWSYDGTDFIDHGTPPGLIAQVKTLVPYAGRLYIAGVPARVVSWDGTAFSPELDATATDSEIYKGTVYAGCLYFPTNRQGPGGTVWKFDGSAWTQDYVDTGTSSQLQVVQQYGRYLWVGGGQREGHRLTLRRTLQRRAPVE